MRETLTKIALVAFIAVLFPIMSCDDPSNPSKLAKHWIIENSGGSMELFKDGTGILDGNVKILWKVEDNYLIIFFEDEPNPASNEYKLSGSKLTFNKLVFIEKAEYDAKNKKKEAVASSEDNLETVQIGTQIWLKRNLNVVPSKGKSFCYGDKPDNCKKYGRLYDWATAMGLDSTCLQYFCDRRIQPKHRGICPAGFHIPREEEWRTLFDFVGGEEVAGEKLKAKSGWNDYDYLREAPNGTDAYGFAALPGAGAIINLLTDKPTSDITIGDKGRWWSASWDGTNYGTIKERAIRVGMSNESKEVGIADAAKWSLYSVRCVKD